MITRTEVARLRDRCWEAFRDAEMLSSPAGETLTPRESFRAIAQKCIDTLIALQDAAKANPGDFDWRQFLDESEKRKEDGKNDQRAKDVVRERLIKSYCAATAGFMDEYLSTVVLAASHPLPQVQQLSRQLFELIKKAAAEHAEKKRAAGNPTLIDLLDTSWRRKMEEVEGALNAPEKLKKLAAGIDPRMVLNTDLDRGRPLGDFSLSRGSPAKR